MTTLGHRLQSVTGDTVETPDFADRDPASSNREKARNSKSYGPIDIGSGDRI